MRTKQDEDVGYFMRDQRLKTIVLECELTREVSKLVTGQMSLSLIMKRNRRNHLCFGVLGITRSVMNMFKFSEDMFIW